MNLTIRCRRDGPDGPQPEQNIRPHTHDMTDLREQYKATTLRILANFQLLEFALKAYIGRAYATIKVSVGDKVPFGYGKADVESFPLERLLNVFSKLNADTALQARLNKLREERNHIAHRSLIITMGSLYDPGAVEDKYIEYVDLEDEVLECLKLVLKEAKALKERTSSAA